ncbi:MAG: tryptophan-rich sensory protein [Lachnospiraceae bacterium]|nr:tryptophan-rich sensory protein [Lachnospiraceae bacterium]
MKKRSLIGIIIGIGIPLLTGGISALLTRKNMQLFDTLKQPPLSPPGWLFPVAWTILYILMGLASYYVYRHKKSEQNEEINSALRLYGLQLFFNFMWSIVFFNLKWYLFAFIWLMILWVMILVMTCKFMHIDRRAGNMIIPYVLWVTFAAYLNLGVYILNR